MGRVVGVENFEGIEPGVGELLDHVAEFGFVLRAKLDGVGEGGDAACGVDGADGFVMGDEVLADVGGAAFADVFIEGFLEGGDDAHFQKGLGDVRPTDDLRAGAPGDGDDLGVVDVDAEGLEFGDDLGVAPASAGEDAGADLGEAGIVVADVEPEDVESAPFAESAVGEGGGLGEAQRLGVGGDFDARNDVDAHRLACGEGFGDADGGVVVGDGDGLEADAGGLVDELGGGESAVRAGGVGVKVDERHGGMIEEGSGMRGLLSGQRDHWKD